MREKADLEKVQKKCLAKFTLLLLIGYAEAKRKWTSFDPYLFPDFNTFSKRIFIYEKLSMSLRGGSRGWWFHFSCIADMLQPMLTVAVDRYLATMDVLRSMMIAVTDKASLFIHTGELLPNSCDRCLMTTVDTRPCFIKMQFVNNFTLY